MFFVFSDDSGTCCPCLFRAPDKKNCVCNASYFFFTLSNDIAIYTSAADVTGLEVYKTSERITYFTPCVTALPSCTKLPLAEP